MAGSIFRSLLRRLLPSRVPPPAAEDPQSDEKEEDEPVPAVVVDPRARDLQLAERVERTASGAGFQRLRTAGIPAWADAIAKRPGRGDAVDPGFGDAASLSGSPETRLALGPDVRRALTGALVHAPAVRLGDGFAEVIVPSGLAGERGVQDAVLTIAEAFTGPPSSSTASFAGRRRTTPHLSATPACSG